MKKVEPAVASLMKASRPKISWITIHQRGRPLLSMYMRNLGPIPLDASACMVRVEPKVHELATLRTDMVMTALKTDGRPLTPASWIASTKGEALVSPLDEPRMCGSLEGTIKPIMKSEMT